MDGISFQEIFGLCGLRGHIVEIRWDVTLVHGRRTTECEDRARILKQNSQKLVNISNVKFFTADPYFGVVFSTGLQKGA